MADFVSASVGRLSDFGLNMNTRGPAWFNQTNCGVGTKDSVIFIYFNINILL